VLTDARIHRTLIAVEVDRDQETTPVSDTTATSDTHAPECGPARPPEHLDVLIIGAGLSGIGAACHLRRNLPRKRFVLLEAREDLGGTWDLFRYPGVRSDSDMNTLGYRFRPWTDPDTIADGDQILRYIRDTAHEYGIDERIRYRRRVVALSFDSDRARWTAEISRTDTGATEWLTADFVYSCTGYYRYDEGYSPAFVGIDRFEGTVIHPQHWPEDVDVAGEHVVVIGSGATAVTLVPALAERAGHVTMLQRSPGYVTSLPSRDPVAARLQRWLPSKLAYGITRWKNIALSAGLYKLSRAAPGLVRRLLRWRMARQLPEGFDIDTHFNPSYDPWDQRLCLVPDHDLFKALRRGTASVVTDSTEEVTERGIVLGSGRTLEADVIVTATGLNLLMLGGMELTVDGQQVDPADTVAYKGMMLSGVPNFAFAVGYTNASWTLKVDLASDYVCRLLQHMDERGYDRVTPRPPGQDVALRPLIDLDSGYVRRSIDQLPKQGSRPPWELHQSYLRDIQLFRRGGLDDEGVRFDRAPGRAAHRPPDRRAA
jgi:monooxygenase